MWNSLSLESHKEPFIRVSVSDELVSYSSAWWIFSLITAIMACMCMNIYHDTTFFRHLYVIYEAYLKRHKKMVLLCHGISMLLVDLYNPITQVIWGCFIGTGQSFYPWSFWLNITFTLLQVMPWCLISTKSLTKSEMNKTFNTLWKPNELKDLYGVCFH